MGNSDEKFEQVKGHAKEAVGEVTDDDELKREGRRDRVSGDAKEKIDRAADKLEEGVDKVKDKLTSRDRG